MGVEADASQPGEGEDDRVEVLARAEGLGGGAREPIVCKDPFKWSRSLELTVRIRRQAG